MGELGVPTTHTVEKRMLTYVASLLAQISKYRSKIRVHKYCTPVGKFVSQKIYFTCEMELNKEVNRR